MSAPSTALKRNGSFAFGTIALIVVLLTDNFNFLFTSAAVALHRCFAVVIIVENVMGKGFKVHEGIYISWKSFNDLHALNDRFLIPDLCRISSVPYNSLLKIIKAIKSFFLRTLKELCYALLVC